MNKTKKNRNTYNKTKKNRNAHNKTKKKYIFTKKDYISGDGMQTNIWGPAMWHYLHTMSFNYPIEPTPENKKITEILF